MRTSSLYELAAIVAQAGEGKPSPDEPSGLDSKIGVLPFTGMDLLIVGVVAMLLVIMGFVLRRLSAPRGPTS
jgi:hypothetical protein